MQTTLENKAFRATPCGTTPGSSFGRIVDENTRRSKAERTRRTRLERLELRGKALALFCAGVRERGGRATVEEDLDLPRLRAEWRRLRGGGVAVAVARLDELGPTPVDQARVEWLRRDIESRTARRRPS